MLITFSPERGRRDAVYKSVVPPSLHFPHSLHHLPFYLIHLLLFFPHLHFCHFLLFRWFVFDMKPVLQPVSRISGNIMTQSIKLLLIANDDIMEASLPIEKRCNGSAN